MIDQPGTGRIRAPSTTSAPGTSRPRQATAGTNMAATKAPLTIDDLVKVTNLTKSDLEQLQRKFQQLAPVHDKVDRSHFRDLLCDKFGIDDSLLMDRIFRCFDVDADNYISFDEFAKGMSIFLKGKFDARMKFCFRIYDLNGDRYISKEEMFQLLKNCLVKGAEEDEDGVKDLVDLVLKKLDEDRDGRVSEADYLGAVAKENLLLEAFGQCLPLIKDVEAFLSDNGLADFVRGGTADAESPRRPGSSQYLLGGGGGAAGGGAVGSAARNGSSRSKSRVLVP
ncbi:hypothetical protein AMAG_08596 [Allomyces macrogynus ATCC 38327]|uniref:EF-hand domain-containing protein n=1 Tax=Allomyces macrogynus (strain ATCC 38327) TaxID=578462 RepID=A0A0L0SM86_ALLM3|nr:hypothetical protein AMAG_08596 [Allomyces macrogynus ATCC 38327]|eukprot:KNE63470.1 hypothetical protein AMAG_08596 [Allomyces macrogynus ATCC 38327]